MYTPQGIVGISTLLLFFITLTIISRPWPRERPKDLPRKERRDSPRYKTSLRIKYRTPLDEGVSWLEDISRSGARLFLNKTLKSVKIGEPLEIEIDLPSRNEPICIKGNIVWAKEDDAGFQFSDMLEEDMGKILRDMSG